jgi:membrane-bound acyltransferase YfiQ involved in biofilm formation
MGIGWSIAAFLVILGLATLAHHLGVRKLSREAPALLAMTPALIMLGAWLLLIVSAAGVLGPFVIPAAIVAVVPFILLARAAMRVINHSRADRMGMVDAATARTMADSILAEVTVVILAGTLAAIVLIVLLVIKAATNG